MVEAEYIVNRLEIIDHTPDGNGRDYTKWDKHDFEVAFSQQDDGKTLKIFLQPMQTNVPNDEELRKKLHDLFSRVSFDELVSTVAVDEAMQLITAYTTRQCMKEMLLMRKALTGDGIHNGDPVDYTFDRYRELEATLTHKEGADDER